MSPLKYSFVLIAYNEAANIRRCIDSIMNQTKLGNSYEIIVADDGSIDATAATVQDSSKLDSHIRLVGDGHNHGRGYGRYTGVNESHGEYIIMIDADIILPESWLETVLPYTLSHEVAGGIAVPDGDVAYVYERFQLKPKVVMGSTTITGNNGIYKASVFEKLNFDPLLREGEDVDFNYRAQAAGLTAICVPGLVVEHQEHKSFKRSLLWLYQSGVGATRQLVRFKQIRLPDLAFVATLSALIVAIVLMLTLHEFWPAALPVACLLGVSFLHIHGKFHLANTGLVRGVQAVAVDALFIAGYYVGRLVGFATYQRSSKPAAQPSSEGVASD